MGMSTCMIVIARDVRSKRKAGLAENPLGSLPAHMRTWKETKALSRVLDEPDVTKARLAAAAPATDQGTSQCPPSSALGARYAVISICPIADIQQRRGTAWQRARTGLLRANSAGRASADPRGARMHGGDRGADMFPFCRSLSGDPDVFSGASGKVTARRGERGRDHLFADAGTILAESGEPGAGTSRSAWPTEAHGPAPACLWSDDALAPTRTRNAQARSP